MFAKLVLFFALVALAYCNFDEEEDFENALDLYSVSLPGEFLEEQLLDRRRHHHHHHRRPKCDKTKLKKCSSAYIKDLGMKTPPKNATGFVKFLQDLIEKKQKAGFEKICNATNKFFKCLGRKEIFRCLSLRSLMHMGLKPTDAFIYNIAGKQLGYECNPGYKTIIEKWDCLVKTGKQSEKQLKKCGDDFKKHVKEHKRMVCRYADQFLNCTSAPFAKSCGDKAGHVLCATSRIAFKTLLHRCHHLRCRRPKFEDIVFQNVQEDDTLDDTSYEQ